MHSLNAYFSVSFTEHIVINPFRKWLDTDLKQTRVEGQRVCTQKLTQKLLQKRAVSAVSNGYFGFNYEYIQGLTTPSPGPPRTSVSVISKVHFFEKKAVPMVPWHPGLYGPMEMNLYS